MTLDLVFSTIQAKIYDISPCSPLPNYAMFEGSQKASGRNRVRRISIVAVLLVSCIALCTLTSQIARAQSDQSAQTSVVISQMYGGGGNSGALYTHDFIELFNQSEKSVVLEGWSVQYASATGTSWQMTELSGTIPAGGYYLIYQAQGSRGSLPLPPADAVGTIPMSASSGKIALLGTTDLLARGTLCPSGPSVIDLLGFGQSNCFSGPSAAPQLDNKNAALRADDGCAATGRNSDDFAAGPPTPRNSATSPTMCNARSPSSASRTSVATARLRPFPAGASSITTQTIALRILAALTPTLEATTVSTPAIPTSAIPTSTVPISTISSTADRGKLVISQIYGGGGNRGARYANDFVELYNPGSLTVTIDGWSMHYASATGKTWLVTVLSGTVAPGESYLIEQAEGRGGVPLPLAAEAVGDIAMSASSGKVALMRGVEPGSGPCPAAEETVDFVGYGKANCFEGEGPAPELTNTQALVRAANGTQDTNNNQSDFALEPPALGGR